MLKRAANSETRATKKSKIFFSNIDMAQIYVKFPKEYVINIYLPSPDALEQGKQMYSSKGWICTFLC